MNASEQVAVHVDGESIDVWVAQKGKVTWHAWTTFRGKHMDATGSSRANAIDKWKQMADYASKE
jgi:hypothetical protein